MSLTNLLVPAFSQTLRSLSYWLDKARQQRSPQEAEALLSARLADDMHPLATQVRFTCFQAQETVFKLRGDPRPDHLDQLAEEGRNAGERPGSIADAQARIAEAVAFLDGLEADALDAGAERAIELELPNGMIFDMTGAQYARDWAIPQYHFHLVAAYAVLRNQGLEIGKADYVPHMMPYLRPGTLPPELMPKE